MSRKRPFGEFGSPTWGVGRPKHLLIPRDELLVRFVPDLEPYGEIRSRVPRDLSDYACSRCGARHNYSRLNIWHPCSKALRRELWKSETAIVSVDDPDGMMGDLRNLDRDEAWRRGMEQIELAIAVATGQTPRVEASMHRNIAERILNWAGFYSWGTDPDTWGEPILAAYWDHEHLGPLLRDLQKAWKLLAEEEKTPPLSGQQASLIVGHEPLVQATAIKLLQNPRGQINQFNFAALVDLGQSILIQQVRRYDPHRGVTFGKFVEKRLKGAMVDWLLENNHLYLDIGDDGGWTAEPAQKYVRDTAPWFAEPKRGRGRPRGSRGKSGAKSVVRKKSGATRGVESLDRNLEVLSQYTPGESRDRP